MPIFASKITDASSWCATTQRKKLWRKLSANVPGKSEIREFDPQSERLADVLREIKRAYGDQSAPPLRISLIAPLPFLRKEGIRPEDLEPDAGFAGLRIFANCCTAENVPVRHSRTMLSSSLSCLVKLSDELLEMLPFSDQKGWNLCPYGRIHSGKIPD